MARIKGPGALCKTLQFTPFLSSNLANRVFTIRPVRFLPIFLILVSLTGCSVRRLPTYEKPLKRAEYQKVRTTAYTHSEDDHLKHGRKTALGGRLQYGSIKSAAADWARWPAGTRFQIVETGELFEVDDYGWALAGTNTIDLYKPSRREMNRWGVRRVTIHVLHWGDPNWSYKRLKPARKHKHVKRMLWEIEKFY